ncbi:MAG: hypothetical protein PHP50_07790 [Lachnospiraceae bacterium]|nr:hypothetical protein [Lachnospiraceae bacterium]
MSNINQLEDNLFAEWKNESGYITFASDGVVDPETWEKQKVKLLFVLKEVNAENQNFDLRFFLKNGGNKNYWRTWNNVARWTKGILEGGDYIRKVSKADKTYYLSKIAAMNLKKVGGRAFAENEKIREYTKRDAYYIKKQILLYNPDIIICCGRGDGKNADLLFEDVLTEEVCSNWKRTANGFYYFEIQLSEKKHVPVISFYHPQMRGGHAIFEKRYHELMQVMKEI